MRTINFNGLLRHNETMGEWAFLLLGQLYRLVSFEYNKHHGHLKVKDPEI